MFTRRLLTSSSFRRLRRLGLGFKDAVHRHLKGGTGHKGPGLAPCTVQEELVRLAFT